MKNTNWTKEETIVAFNVYCKIPFKDSNKAHPTIIQYAEIIGRSPSALNMKIGNFGRLDPALKEQGIVGLSHGSKLEEEVWNAFNGNWEKLAYESELLIAQFSNKSLEEVHAHSIEVEEIGEGKERETLIKQRINQRFFRDSVLSSYNYRCCITGLPLTDMLIASHIIPWAKNTTHRLNPRNGLCLNAFHDKAFDRGYITITPDYHVKLSQAIIEQTNDAAIQQMFLPYKDKKIGLPDKFIPEREFLDFHYMNVFLK